MLDPRDLRDFTGLGTTEILQKQNVRIGVSWEMIRWHLEGMYGEVEEVMLGELPAFKVSRLHNCLLFFGFLILILGAVPSRS